MYHAGLAFDKGHAAAYLSLTRVHLKSILPTVTVLYEYCNMFLMQTIHLQYGLTPLMMATLSEHTEVSKILLEAGADVNLQCNNVRFLFVQQCFYSFNHSLEYSCNKYSNLIGQLEVHYFTYGPRGLLSRSNIGVL